MSEITFAGVPQLTTSKATKPIKARIAPAQWVRLFTGSRSFLSIDFPLMMLLRGQKRSPLARLSPFDEILPSNGRLLRNDRIMFCCDENKNQAGFYIQFVNLHMETCFCKRFARSFF